MNKINSNVSTIFLLAIIFSVQICGCGYYSFSGSGLVGIETVYVPLFGNSTSEFGLEEQLTDALIMAVNAESNLNIADRDQADSILEGRIVGISDVPMTYSAGEVVSEFKVQIRVRVKFEDLKNRQVIVEEDLSAFGIYPYPVQPGDDRQKGIDEAVKKLAEDIINKAVSGW